MKRSFSILAIVLTATACDDETSKPAGLTTAPQIAPAAVGPAAAVSAAAISGGSTICRVYVTERDVAKSALDAAPADTLLQRRVTTLDALVGETCN